MIKSGAVKGEFVEPRVGDDVRIDRNFNKQDKTIRTVIRVDEKYVKVDEPGDPYSILWGQQHCTLMHRSWEVGDIVCYVTKSGRRIELKIKNEMEGMILSDFGYVLKNRAWRNHSEYKAND